MCFIPLSTWCCSLPLCNDLTASLRSTSVQHGVSRFEVKGDACMKYLKGSKRLSSEKTGTINLSVPSHFSDRGYKIGPICVRVCPSLSALMAEPFEIRIWCHSMKSWCPLTSFWQGAYVTGGCVNAQVLSLPKGQWTYGPTHVLSDDHHAYRSPFEWLKGSHPVDIKMVHLRWHFGSWLFFRVCLCTKGAVHIWGERWGPYIKVNLPKVRSRYSQHGILPGPPQVDIVY